MANKVRKNFGRKSLAVIMALVMMFSLLNLTALAAQELVCAQPEHSHSDSCYETFTHEHSGEDGDCYTDHVHGRRCDSVAHTHAAESCAYETHSHGDSCYKPHEHGQSCYDLSCTESEHVHSHDCYFIFALVCDEGEHRHGDGCYTLNCQLEGSNDLVCGYNEGDSVWLCTTQYEYPNCPARDLSCQLNVGENTVKVCQLNEHSHGKNCYREGDKAEHLDIHINLTAKYTVDGKSYDASVILTGADYTSGRLTITSTGNRHNITRHGDSVDAGQYRFHGTFPVGTYANPVNYTITLVKDVDFLVEGETVTIPMTFSKTVNYWTDNICESLLATRGYKNGSWAAGEFVGGHMDFKLGASEATGSTDPVDPDPIEPAKYTLTVQKNVAGITLDAAKEYVFGVYSGDAKVDTIEVTVAAGGSIALGTTALTGDETYYVVEEGSPDITGYTLATTAAVGTGNAVAGATSDSFTLSGDTSVVFTNTYAVIEQPPVNPDPPAPQTEEWTIIHNYYLDGTLLEGSNSSTVEVEVGQQPTYEREWYYNDEYYTALGVDHVDAAAKTITMDYTREYYAPPTPQLYPVSYEYTGDVPALAPVVPDTVDYEEGAEVIVAENPTLDGYTFSGWDKENFTMPAEPVVIYGSWTQLPPPAPQTETWTITHNYYLNTETFEGGNSGTVTVEVGQQPAYERVFTYGENSYEAMGDAVIDAEARTITLSYNRVLEQPPVNPDPPAPQTEDWTIIHNYYLNTETFEGGNSGTVTVEVGQQPAYERVFTYGENSYEAMGDAVIDAEARTITLNYNRVVEAPPYVPPYTPPYTPPVIINPDPPVVEIPEEDVPLVDIPEEDVPLVDIPDEDVPLADIPKTGDNTAIFAIMAMVSGAALLWIVLSGRRKSEENE